MKNLPDSSSNSKTYGPLFEAIAGYGLGGFFVALFGRVGGMLILAIPTYLFWLIKKTDKLGAWKPYLCSSMGLFSGMIIAVFS